MEKLNSRKKVLVLCHDTVGAKMAGPGIRYINLAAQIKKVASVTFGIYYNSKQAPVQPGCVPVKTVGDSYRALFDKHDVIFAQWLKGDMLQYAHATGKIIIFDFYAPVPIEYLAGQEFSANKIPPEKDLEYFGVLETYKQYLSMGDFFVCSNERQLDFWFGFMTAANIFTATTFSKYMKADKFGLCPMGISSSPPSSKSLKLRKKVGLGKDDFVLLWTGGIWDWFDAKTVIKAVHQLNNPKVKLVFLGTQHPNTKVYKKEMSESTAARRLSESLGLTGKSVFFLDGWVDYDERASYLMDADVAIYADKDSVETRFSHRTRVLDHIWADLPTICSRGDYLSEEVRDKAMGIVVEARTPAAFAAAIKQAYDEPDLLREIKANIKAQSRFFTWDALSVELLSFIKQSHLKKPDKEKLANTPPPQTTDYRAMIPRRVKNSIKVLIGRIDV